MAGKKKEKILQVRGQELEDYRRYYDWVNQGSMEKYTSVFVPLSDDRDDSPSVHNARRIREG